MLWVGFCSRGSGSTFCIDYIMDSGKNQVILNQNLTASAKVELWLGLPVGQQRKTHITIQSKLVKYTQN